MRNGLVTVPNPISCFCLLSVMAKSLFDNTTAHVLRTVTSMGPDGRKVTHVETFVRERSSNKSGTV